MKEGMQGKNVVKVDLAKEGMVSGSVIEEPKKAKNRRGGKKVKI